MRKIKNGVLSEIVLDYGAPKRYQNWEQVENSLKSEQKAHDNSTDYLPSVEQSTMYFTYLHVFQRSKRRHDKSSQIKVASCHGTIF